MSLDCDSYLNEVGGALVTGHKDHWCCSLAWQIGNCLLGINRICWKASCWAVVPHSLQSQLRHQQNFLGSYPQSAEPC